MRWQDKENLWLGDALTDRKLLRAVHKLDVAGVEALLGQGPSMHALGKAIGIIRRHRDLEERREGERRWRHPGEESPLDRISLMVLARNREIREGKWDLICQDINGLCIMHATTACGRKAGCWTGYPA